MTISGDPSIMRGQEAQDQVILPLRVAFGICLRGLKTRLGRSIITLTGVGLGIAFLMSVVAGFHIRQSMRWQTEQARAVERRLTVLRTDVGRLQNRPVFLVYGPPSDTDAAFVRALQQRDAELSGVAGPNATLPPGVARVPSVSEAAEAIDVILFVGRMDSVIDPQLAEALAGQTVYVFDSLPETVQASLAAHGTSLERLGIELRPEEVEAAEQRERQAVYRMYWIVGVSLLITVGGITNAMLMSVTERFREIATMKCLGALSSFVVKLFLIESSLMGLAGSIFGILVGLLFPMVAYSYTFGFVQVFSAVNYGVLAVTGLVCIVIGVVLSVVAGIYPARVAARMIPADALATEV